jgi:hypothetical protein
MGEVQNKESNNIIPSAKTFREESIVILSCDLPLNISGVLFPQGFLTDIQYTFKTPEMRPAHLILSDSMTLVIFC